MKTKTLISAVLLFLVAFGSGCTTFGSWEKEREVKYSYDYIEPKAGDRLLPPPQPDLYYGDSNKLYLEPSEPYLEDLISYSNYLARYINDFVSEVEHSGIDANTCEEMEKEVELPAEPKRPLARQAKNSRELLLNYVSYSKKLYSHYIEVVRLYDEHLNEIKDNCNK